MIAKPGSGFATGIKLPEPGTKKKSTHVINESLSIFFRRVLEKHLPS
jgi:hypothetical protein